MATYDTDLNLVNAADSDTDWAELSGHQSGGAPDADAENYIQNSSSVSQSTGQASTTAAGMQYDYGSDLGSGWVAGHVFLVWQYYTAPTNINSWANGGMRIGVGSSSGNMNFWNAMGDDFGGSPYACWQNTAIDPSDPTGATYAWLTADTSDGSPSTGNYTFFGSLPNVRAKITKGSPHANDVIRYGRGEIYATGTGADFDGYGTANDGDTARWGLFQSTRGGYLWKGLFSLGQTGTSVTFSDSNVSIFVDDTPRVNPNFNRMEINNSSSSVTWVGISITGVGLSITGSTPASPGDFENIDSGIVDWTGCTFTDIGTFTFNTTTNDNDIVNTIFRRCGQVAQNGATITGCTFDESTSTEALVVDDLDIVTECTFNSAGTGHAVDLGTISSTTAMAWDNQESGYATQVGTAGNRTILVNVAVSQTLTINVAAGGASTPTYYNTGSGDVNVVAGSVDVDATVTTTTGVPVSGALVYIQAKDDTGPFPFEDVVTIVNSGTTATVTHTAHGMATADYVTIDGGTLSANEGVFQITLDGATPDDKYSYTMLSTPGSSPTGTIISTFVALYGLTDSLGVKSVSRVYASDQPITGWARKSSGSPYYKEGSISGSIDSVDGLTATAVLVLDE